MSTALRPPAAAARRAPLRGRRSASPLALGALLLGAPAPAAAAPELIPLEVFEAAKAATVSKDTLQASFPLRDGGSFSLAAHAGRPILLSFWASWCAPCRRELPALSRWATEHPDVTIVAVNVDRTRPEADRFLQRVSFDLPVAFDPDAKVLGAYGAISMPTMFLFDRSGQLVWRHTGYSEEKGFTELDAALGGAR